MLQFSQVDDSWLNLSHNSFPRQSLDIKYFLSILSKTIKYTTYTQLQILFKQISQ